MRYDTIRTEDSIEIRDGGDVIASFDTWPPREEEGLEMLFDDANISTQKKELFKILFGVVELDYENEA